MALFQLLYVLDRLFDSFSNESLSGVDDQNNNNVGELSDRTRGEMNTDSWSIFDHYSDVSDDESDYVNPEDELRTVLSMLDDASLLEFGVYDSVNMQSLIGIGPVVMDVLANIQINTCVIFV